MTNPECATSHDLAVTDIGCDLGGYPVRETRVQQSATPAQAAAAVTQQAMMMAHERELAAVRIAKLRRSNPE